MCLIQVSALILPLAQVSNYTHISNLFVEINHLGMFARQVSSGWCDPGHGDCQRHVQNPQSLALAAVCGDMSNK